MMDIQRRFALLSIFSLLLLTSGSSAEDLEIHGSWEDGNYMIYHATCTFETRIIIADFNVELEINKVAQAVTTWSLTPDGVLGGQIYYFKSNGTAYPPRLVLTFHIHVQIPGSVPIRSARGPSSIPLFGSCTAPELTVGASRLPGILRPGNKLPPFGGPFLGTTQHPCVIMTNGQNPAFGGVAQSNGDDSGGTMSPNQIFRDREPFPSNGRGPLFNDNGRGPLVDDNSRGPLLDSNGRGPFINGNGRGPLIDGNGQGPSLDNHDVSPGLDGNDRGPAGDWNDRGPLRSPFTTPPSNQPIDNEAGSPMRNPSLRDVPRNRGSARTLKRRKRGIPNRVLPGLGKDSNFGRPANNDTRPDTTDSPSGDVIKTLPNYTESISQSLLFYAAQRSGQLPVDALLSVPWQRSSATNDSGIHGEDLSGGWYIDRRTLQNGNDYVKFNFPMAASTTFLGLSLYEWNMTYEENGLTEKLLETIKWPLDYFLKCWNADRQELYVQVGDVESDMSEWTRPEAMSYERRAFFVSAEKPGSDVAAEMAAAMTIASVLFKATDELYADKLLSTAKELFSFAQTYLGRYSDHIPEAANYYPSSGYEDELCLAAVLLHKVTGKIEYLSNAEDFFSEYGATELSWDKKNILAAVYLYDVTGSSLYGAPVKTFLSTWIDEVDYTPDGLAWLKTPGPLRYAANAAFVALLAIQKGIVVETQQLYGIWAKRQIDYMLGDNQLSMSYQVGVGESYPVSYEHKMSSCPLLPATCGTMHYTESTFEPNLYTLSGALVGGPDIYGNHIDSRSNFDGNDVAIDYNAGFTAALAGLYTLRQEIKTIDEVCQDFLTSKGITESTKAFSTTTPSSTSPSSSLSSTYSSSTFSTVTYPWYSSTFSSSAYSGLASRSTPTASPLTPASFDYSDALSKSILFYKAQRSGIFHDGDAVSWRVGYPQDAGELHHIGGWYDDGSAVKTTLATASTVTLLGWGYLAFEDGYLAGGQIEAIKDCLRWPLDYLLKSWDTRFRSLVRKVGKEPKNRGLWARPEKQDKNVYKVRAPIGRGVDSLIHGKDFVADIASAMAVGSIVFKSDVSYAADLLKAAREVYSFAKMSLVGQFLDDESVYYKVTNDEQDEMCLAALWLYKATGEQIFLEDAETFFDIRKKYSINYQDKQILCQTLMYEVSSRRSDYQGYIVDYLAHWIDDSKSKLPNQKVHYTPDGLAWYSQDAPLRSAANSAFFALLAADMGLETAKYRTWALSQIQYMLGSNQNAFSYQIGYGERYPVRPHHRASSCPDEMESCDWSIYNDPEPNPHVLVGALVAGPDWRGYHEDCRANYTMNRVAIDYNAGFQSALAGILKYKALEETSTMTSTKITPSKSTKYPDSSPKSPTTTKPTTTPSKTTSSKPTQKRTFPPVQPPTPEEFPSKRPSLITKEPPVPTTRPKPVNGVSEGLDNNGGGSSNISYPFYVILFFFALLL